MSRKKSDAVDALKAAKQATQALRDEAQAIVDEHVAKTKERAAVERALESRETVLANCDAVVDQANARWRETYAATIVRQLSQRRELIPGTTRETPTAPALPHWGRTVEGVFPLTFADLCGLVPDVMKATLRGLVEDSKAPFGLDGDERAAKLAELAADLADLEARHAELCDGSPVDLPQIPVVVARREAEDAKRRQGVTFSDNGFSVGADMSNALPSV